ncbi:MAG: ATP-binding protein, partial [Flavobacterium sp.]
TYNILAMLTAVYQSDDKPQFLCIEEPENGLHPQVAGELIDFFRIMCEERGHHIWLNTHSQSMIARLRPEEMVIVDKKKGATRTKQISKEDFKNWRMDEALLTNAFGGGLPW